MTFTPPTSRAPRSSLFDRNPAVVLVVSFGRLGDIYGRVKIYNLGFVVFTDGSIALAFDPFTGATGVIWLIVWRLVQGAGGAMLFANSTAILTDAFPANRRGLALGTNQVAAIAGSFIGLIVGGRLAGITYAIQPYGGSSTGFTNPWVLADLRCAVRPFRREGLRHGGPAPGDRGVHRPAADPGQFRL